MPRPRPPGATSAGSGPPRACARAPSAAQVRPLPAETALTTLVVGDVHGCAAELAELLASHPADRVVFVGDLFTKGPDPVGVWSLAAECEAVLGNHEARLLDVCAGRRPKDAHGAAVVKRLNRAASGWRAWVERLPLTLEVPGFTVVHAALADAPPTPRKVAILQRRRAWQAKGQRWWQVYTGPPVVFGHDAVRGLVRVERAGRPHVVGLDSGCVYGGFLSGYLVEEDRIVSVRARRTYRST